MNKKQLVKEVLAGKSVERIPFTFSAHMPGIDLDPDLLAQETYKFYKEYQLDYIKTINNGMYSIEDYGVTIDHEPVKRGGVAQLVETPIKEYADLAKIEELSLDQGAMKRELSYLDQLLTLIDTECPVAFIVYSPLTSLHKLVGNRLHDFISHDEEGLVHQALETIARSHKKLTQKVIEMGADGIYFATQSLSRDNFTEEVMSEYARPYDLKTLEGAQEGWFNIIHIHGENIAFELAQDYPVQVFNWHIGEALPTLIEGHAKTQKTIMGGLQRMDITHDSRESLAQQIETAVKDTRGQHLLLAPGCGVRLPYRKDTIQFIQSQLRQAEAKYL